MPIRRSGVFISKICLTIVFAITSLFVIFGLTKYLIKTDPQRYIPVQKNFFENHNHGHRRV